MADARVTHAGGTLMQFRAWLSWSHAAFLWGQFRDSHEDRHVKHSVLTIWTFCAAMSLRLAEACRWVHTPPPSALSWHGSDALVHTANDFWTSASNAPLLFCLLTVAGWMTLFGQLEGWDHVRQAGLWLAVICWYYIFGVVWQSLGFSSSAIFLAAAMVSSRVLISVHNAAREDAQQRRDREAQAIEAVKLAAAIIDMVEVVPEAKGAICTPPDLRMVGG